MFELIHKGGPLMLLIIGCSVVSVAIFMERIIHLYRSKIDTAAFMSQMREVMQRNRLQDALDMCRNTPGPIAHILGVGLLKHDRTREEIRKAMDDAAVHEVGRMEKHLNILAMIAQISPLLGLLGTVTGMISTFKVIQEKAVAGLAVNPGNLAGGIWEALITTAGGLVVAIPAYMAYHYLTSRIDYVVMEMEENAGEMVDLLISGRSGHAH